MDGRTDVRTDIPPSNIIRPTFGSRPKHKNIKNSVKTELYKNQIVTEVYPVSSTTVPLIIIAKSWVSDD